MATVSGGSGAASEELIHVEDFGTVLSIVRSIAQINSNIRNTASTISDYNNRILTDWDDGRASTSFGNSLKQNISSLNELTNIVEDLCTSIDKYIEEVKVRESQGY